MRETHRKLVRDLIPEIVRATGKVPVVRVLDDGDYLAALRAKLVEEAVEARDAAEDELLAELADVYQVLLSLAAAAGLPWADVEATAEEHAALRGAFVRRLFLEAVDDA